MRPVPNYASKIKLLAGHGGGACNPPLFKRLRQESCKLEVSLGSIERCCLKIKIKKDWRSSSVVEHPWVSYTRMHTHVHI